MLSFNLGVYPPIWEAWGWPYRALAFSIAGVSNGEAERRVFQEAKHPAGKFQQRIDVSRLRAGLYFFRAEVAGKSYVRQFLVSGK